MFGSGAVSTHICPNRALPTLQANLDSLTMIIFRGKSLICRTKVKCSGIWFPPASASATFPLPALRTSACSVCLAPLTFARSPPPQLRSGKCFPFAAEPGVICCRVSLAAASSLYAQVSCRIYLCSSSVSHCSSYVQQNNYILAQKLNRTRAFVLASSCLPVCSLLIHLRLKQFSLKHFKTLPISSPRF